MTGLYGFWAQPVIFALYVFGEMTQTEDRRWNCVILPFNNTNLVIFICGEERKRGETAKREAQSREEVGKTQRKYVSQAAAEKN